MLAIGVEAPARLEAGGVDVETVAVCVGDDGTGALRDRYLGQESAAVYLLRPDQHVAARWTGYDERQVSAAALRAIGRT
jgi:3-(3-hydroxy-phenyl)propionate hydroxylase